MQMHYAATSAMQKVVEAQHKARQHINNTKWWNSGLNEGM
jgi:hypothetical protein